MDPLTFVEHRCFLLREIFEPIIDCLPLSQRERALSRLATTCKALNETSTPALWHSLDSLRPLLRLLPSDSWNEAPDLLGRPFLTMTDRDVPISDWTRFNYYARYVRRLDYGHPEDFCELSLCTVFSLHPPTSPLLPQLRTFFFDRGCVAISLVRFFLAPTIEHLKIAAPSEFLYEHDLVSLMNEVVANHRNLRYLCLEVCSHYPDADVEGSKRLSDPTEAEASALMPLLHALPDLQVYDGRLNMTAARTEALAVLPRLAVVRIDIKRAEMKTVAAAARLRVHDPCAAPWFASLTSLSLLFDRLDEDTLVFLGAIQSPGLRMLKIEVEEQPDTDTVRKHCAAIVHAPYRNSFTTFDLACECYTDDARDQMHAGEALRPLYALRRMRTVIVRGFVLFAGPETLRDIAKAWPQLETLSLACVPVQEDRGPDYPHIVLADVVPFVLACPRLRGLDIELHAVEVPDAAALAQLLPGSSHSALEDLAVNYGPIVDVPRVADFLRRMFPRLRALWHTGVRERMPYYPWSVEPPYPNRAEWEEVRELVAPLRMTGAAAGTPMHKLDMPREAHPFKAYEPLLEHATWK